MAAGYNLLKDHGSEARLRQAAQRDETVASAIKAELAALKGVHPNRCVVTQEYREALQRVVESLE